MYLFSYRAVNHEKVYAPFLHSKVEKTISAFGRFDRKRMNCFSGKITIYDKHREEHPFIAGLIKTGAGDEIKHFHNNLLHVEFEDDDDAALYGLDNSILIKESGTYDTIPVCAIGPYDKETMDEAIGEVNSFLNHVANRCKPFDAIRDIKYMADVIDRRLGKYQEALGTHCQLKTGYEPLERTDRLFHEYLENVGSSVSSPIEKLREIAKELDAIISPELSSSITLLNGNQVSVRKFFNYLKKKIPITEIV